MPRRRGIFRYRQLFDGLRVYYALTSAGELLVNGIRVVWPGLSEATVVATLASDLNAADPLRARLALVKERAHVRPPAADLSPASFVMLLRERQGA